MFVTLQAWIKIISVHNWTQYKSSTRNVFFFFFTILLFSLKEKSFYQKILNKTIRLNTVQVIIDRMWKTGILREIIYFCWIKYKYYKAKKKNRFVQSENPRAVKWVNINNKVVTCFEGHIWTTLHAHRSIAALLRKS